MTETQLPNVAAVSDYIVAEVNKQLASDAIRSLVEKQIGQTVNAAVIEAFRSFGNLNEQIRKAVADALALNGKLDLPAYGNTIMAMLRTKMDSVLHDLVAERLAKETEEILRIAPKEIKLSTIVEAMMGEIDKEERYGSRATCIVEASEGAKGYHHVYIDVNDIPSRDKYRCDLRIGVTGEGNIYSLIINKSDASKTFVMGHLPQHQKMVFAAYCCGSKLIVDEMEFSTSIGDW